MLFLVTRAPRTRSEQLGVPRGRVSCRPLLDDAPASPTSELGVCTCRRLLPVPTSGNCASLFSYEFVFFPDYRTSEITPRPSLSFRWSLCVCDPVLRRAPPSPVQNGPCRALPLRPGTLNEFGTRALRSHLHRAWKLCEITSPADYPQHVCSLAWRSAGGNSGAANPRLRARRTSSLGRGDCTQPRLSCHTLFKYRCLEIRRGTQISPRCWSGGPRPAWRGVLRLDTQGQREA